MHWAVLRVSERKLLSHVPAGRSARDATTAVRDHAFLLLPSTLPTILRHFTRKMSGYPTIKFLKEAPIVGALVATITSSGEKRSDLRLVQVSSAAVASTSSTTSRSSRRLTLTLCAFLLPLWSCRTDPKSRAALGKAFVAHHHRVPRDPERPSLCRLHLPCAYSAPGVKDDAKRRDFSGHSSSHSIPPSSVPARANIAALKVSFFPSERHGMVVGES